LRQDPSAIPRVALQILLAGLGSHEHSQLNRQRGCSRVKMVSTWGISRPPR
jgi:hypothetical protein